jgi:type II secretory pathway pseudopilin PulG
MRLALNSPPRRNHGITLLEVAIGLLCLGVMMAGGIALYNGIQQQRRFLVTHEHMDEIVSALSIYAETAGRVPCPSDPSATDITFGWEENLTINGVVAVPQSNALNVTNGQFPTGKCNAANNEGIVPFMTLNLPYNIAQDGWGRYFTYAVSPQFSRTNDQSHLPTGAVNTVPDVGAIHARCRTEGWAGRFDGNNISAVKARFCCDDQQTNGWNATAFSNATDLIIKFTNLATTLSPQRDVNSNLPANYTNNNGAGGTVYDSLTSTVLSNVVVPGGLPTAISSVQSPILTPAMVLISHGPNGRGAYLANGTKNRYSPPLPGPLEALNAAPGVSQKTFYDGPANLKQGAKYFDNIVRWMTQDSLMAAHGALSCQYP